MSCIILSERGRKILGFFSELSWELAEFKSPVMNSNFHACFQWFFKITRSCNKVEINNCCQVQTPGTDCAKLLSIYRTLLQCRNRTWNSCLASLCTRNGPQKCSTGNTWASCILLPPAGHLCTRRYGLKHQCPGVGVHRHFLHYRVL